MERGGCIYILTNKNKTTLYVGVTSNLRSRIYDHKTHKHINSFSDRYNLEYCIYYEAYPTIADAIGREKEIKKWRRQKKIQLIERLNPSWNDLWEEIKNW